MGQKTNPNILRLGKTKTWALQYFEKKSTEMPTYAFQSLELKKFIYKFFKDNELIIHNCKIQYLNENLLSIFVSYYLTFNSINLINFIDKNQNIKIINKKVKKIKKKFYLTIKKNVKNYISYQNINYKNKLKKSLQKQNYLTANKLIKHEKRSLKIRRLYLLQTYKRYLAIKKNKNIKNIEANLFLSKLFKGLHLFINKKTNIQLTITQLNKNLTHNFGTKETKFLKTELLNLKKYEQNNFFKEGVNTLFNCTTQKNSANLLAQFITVQLKKLKKHKFFLKFIKNTLLIFVNSTFSNLNGIKIKIKGRFNGAPRAKLRTINIGKGVPNLTINAKIYYSEETSFTPNGTFGVKVWTCEK